MTSYLSIVLSEKLKYEIDYASRQDDIYLLLHPGNLPFFSRKFSFVKLFFLFLCLSVKISSFFYLSIYVYTSPILFFSLKI